MALTCSKCSRANPPEAVYCYFDGFALAGRGSPSGPVAVGSQSFNSPFYFPSGRVCRSFNELALACQEEWPAARDLLKQGYLEQFLGGLGRGDLAAAAREAARFPDRDRGLDQLLAKLPSNALSEPKLRVAPLELDLGVLQVGASRRFDLHLENQGMRLLYGTISCPDGTWLAVGEGQGTAEKHFQFTHDLVLPVQVRGDQLRANNKPAEARLMVSSNAGTFPVVVRASVPVKPFPTGVLAGARSPRELAQKCQAAPKEAAALFEVGEVEGWYASNGWSYPVKIPTASGLAAVQQFYEALGLTKPPRVEISQNTVFFSAEPGETLRGSLDVKTPEKKAIYAHGTVDVPWVEVGRAKLNGRVATIPFTIPSVPDRPGETLTTQLHIQSNGNQRFTVPLRLEVKGELPMVAAVEEVLPVVAVEEVLPVVAPPAAIVRENELDFTSPAPPPFEPVRERERERDRDRDRDRDRHRDRDEPPRRRAKAAGAGIGLGHLIPAGLLALAVLGVVISDLILPPPRQPGGNGGGKGTDDLVGKRLLDWDVGSWARFGLRLRDVPDPRPEYQGKMKRLTGDELGATNYTTVNIEGTTYWFGETTPSNVWDRPAFKRKNIGSNAKEPAGFLASMKFQHENILITQRMEIVASETGQLDTCLVAYAIRNTGGSPRKVGLRVLLDTMIGANDGVPFLVPGRKGFVDRYEEFTGGSIPEYIEAVERPDKADDPGTVVQLRMRGGNLDGMDVEDTRSLRFQYANLKGEPGELRLDEPDKLVLARYPGRNKDWEVAKNDPGDDSSVVLYWEPKTVPARSARYLAFTYGLSKLEVGNRLALSAPAAVMPSREFVVTAYVFNAKAGQQVELRLPPELRLAAGEGAVKRVEADAVRTTVFWRVRATNAQGKHLIGASSGAAQARPREVQVKATSIFG